MNLDSVPGRLCMIKVNSARALTKAEMEMIVPSTTKCPRSTARFGDWKGHKGNMLGKE